MSSVVHGAHAETPLCVLYMCSSAGRLAGRGVTLQLNRPSARSGVFLNSDAQTLCYPGRCCGPLSVCLMCLSQVGNLSKRLNIIVTQKNAAARQPKESNYLMREASMNFRKDHPITGTPNSGGMGKDFVYRPVSISLNVLPTICVQLIR